ncbi:MAG TPA: hypothetical protein VML57_03735 [Burkholderiales bacterium]|jgi:hypothetical protein|nr:hypothetical protein [Burkholderiales bacterium]
MRFTAILQFLALMLPTVVLLLLAAVSLADPLFEARAAQAVIAMSDEEAPGR